MEAERPRASKAATAARGIAAATNRGTHAWLVAAGGVGAWCVAGCVPDTQHLAADGVHLLVGEQRGGAQPRAIDHHVVTAVVRSWDWSELVERGQFPLDKRHSRCVQLVCEVFEIVLLIDHKGSK